jgi:hypothetical protein
MSFSIIKYPNRSKINPALGQLFSTRVYINPTGDDAYLQGINRGWTNTAIVSFDTVKIAILIYWSLATGAKFDDIIFYLRDGYTNRVYRRWSAVAGFGKSPIPVTQNDYAILYLTIKDPPTFPANLWLGFVVVRPVYPSGTTSTFTFQTFYAGTQSP